MCTGSAEPLPCVTQQQIDEAERLGRLFGLTYLSIEGYAKLAALLEHLRNSPEPAMEAELEDPPPPPRDHDIPDEVRGWRVG